MLSEWVNDALDVIRWKDLAISFGIVALFMLIRKLCMKYLFSLLSGTVKRSGRADRWLFAFEKPLGLVFVIIGVYIAVRYYVPQNWAYLYTLSKLCRSIGVVAVGWGIFNVMSSSSSLLEGISKKIGIDESSMLIPFLSKTLRFVVVVLIVTIVGSEWGFSINGVVAGMGLGSLAIALAAKDTLGNILGGIVIILEKPFSRGDWILTPTTEGVVEDITFRSSKIRTFADALVTVPNSLLADQPITNWSKMGKRRITYTLDVALDTDRERLAAAVKRIEANLRSNDHIHPGTIFVKFHEFKQSSLGIFLYFFSVSTNWGEYLTVRQETNLMIMEVLEAEGVNLAYPGQRVFVEKEAFEQNA